MKTNSFSKAFFLSLFQEISLKDGIVGTVDILADYVFDFLSLFQEISLKGCE